jgi:phosphoribosylaminoimidazolecarboxamide formyltransferase/IMP cyclohydrolase
MHDQVRYIEGDITAAEMPFWLECFESAPPLLSEAEKTAFLGTLNGVSISSDAFFPFR